MSIKTLSCLHLKARDNELQLSPGSPIKCATNLPMQEVCDVMCIEMTDIRMGENFAVFVPISQINACAVKVN